MGLQGNNKEDHHVWKRHAGRLGVRLPPPPTADTRGSESRIMTCTAALFISVAVTLQKSEAY